MVKLPPMVWIRFGSFGYHSTFHSNANYEKSSRVKTQIFELLREVVISKVLVIISNIKSLLTCTSQMEYLSNHKYTLIQVVFLFISDKLAKSQAEQQRILDIQDIFISQFLVPLNIQVFTFPLLARSSYSDCNLQNFD